MHEGRGGGGAGEGDQVYDGVVDGRDEVGVTTCAPATTRPHANVTRVLTTIASGSTPVPTCRTSPGSGWRLTTR